MKKVNELDNNIKKLCKKQKVTLGQLGKGVGLSAPQIGRVVSGESKLTVEMLLQIAAYLDVDPSEVVNVPISKRLKANCDEALLGAAIDWLLEAGARHHVQLTSKELSQYASYIYKQAAEGPLNFKQTKQLAYSVVEVLQMAKTDKRKL